MRAVVAGMVSADQRERPVSSDLSIIWLHRFLREESDEVGGEKAQLNVTILVRQSLKLLTNRLDGFPLHQGQRKLDVLNRTAGIRRPHRVLPDAGFASRQVSEFHAGRSHPATPRRLHVKYDGT